MNDVVSLGASSGISGLPDPAMSVRSVGEIEFSGQVVPHVVPHVAPGAVSHDADYQDFNRMLQDEESSGIASVASLASGNGFDPVDLVRNVETGRSDMQSALIRASKDPGPAPLYDAMIALSRYDLQTLLLSKVASKVTQAADRLTNLQ